LQQENPRDRPGEPHATGNQANGISKLRGYGWHALFTCVQGSTFLPSELTDR